MKDSYSIVKKLMLTEKGTRLSESENKYLFRVDRSANKVDIKRAVEELFKVGVVAVNTMNRQGKKKRERTPNFGRTANWKCAVVTLKPGDKIDLT
ncbi:MAG TPA: 50S ribosomal protein L23 [Kiritimatiellia bacterium]|nr:50S ribosomal protein L23 [Kiritimatiellia bacterium]HNR94506.1 50S ribosomal protein L23 [Kiritimatiellia bacterium]HNS81156.1 50S ribosomal protein L23 [Kiritimatiellia bacterium]HPA77607.1 50S ribosomal protein L23 [Kiritimatiellia bacterium]HQQ03645.1 50S ribosomal protein L23 [Kiritimatiellia bacterium]